MVWSSHALDYYTPRKDILTAAPSDMDHTPQGLSQTYRDTSEGPGQGRGNGVQCGAEPRFWRLRCLQTAGVAAP